MVLKKPKESVGKKNFKKLATNVLQIGVVASQMFNWNTKFNIMKKDNLKNKSNNANTLLCADNFTGYFDDTNKPIFVGDRLKSEWNYEVIVVKDEDGSYSGKLVCNDKHSCKDIPYALNKGKGYSKIICT